LQLSAVGLIVSRASDRLLSNPHPGLKKNDLLLSTGLRLTFAK